MVAELSSVPDYVCVCPSPPAGVCIPGEGWSRAWPPGSVARRSGVPSPRSHGQQWLPSRTGPHPQKWWTSLWTRTRGANTSCNAVSLCSAPRPPWHSTWVVKPSPPEAPSLAPWNPNPQRLSMSTGNVVWFQYLFQWFCLLQGGFLPRINSTKFKTRLQLLRCACVSNKITVCTRMSSHPSHLLAPGHF